MLEYLIKQDDQISQSMPECENIIPITIPIITEILPIIQD